MCRVLPILLVVVACNETGITDLSPNPATPDVADPVDPGVVWDLTDTLELDGSGPTNTPPTAPGLRIEPPTPTTLDDLIAVMDPPASDPDGDPLSFAWSWSIDGGVPGTSLSETLGSEHTVKGERWTVTVVVSDGAADTAPVSAAVTVVNSRPVVTDVAIAPDPAIVGDALSCAWMFDDADADADLSTAEWYVDGGWVASGTTWVAEAAVGAEVTCQVTPFDGEHAGVPDEHTIVLQPPPCVDEVCNGEDDDCDGAIDEGFTADCDPLACEGEGLVHVVTDDCMADGGGSGTGDELEVYCLDGIARFCLTHETCPWRDGAADDGTTCSRGGLSSDYMVTAWCDEWEGYELYHCDPDGQIYFP